MIFQNSSEFISNVGKGSPLLSLDLGSKIIGIAISDRTLLIATPLISLKRKKLTVDANKIIEIIKNNDIGGIVVGLPINMGGSEGPMCQSVRQFTKNFIKLLDIPIFLWDERMSSMAVESVLIEADMSRKRRGEVIDKVAAAYILQGFLDSLKK